jgi:hypothetical protein
MTETVDESKRNRRTAKRILAIGLPLVLIGSVGLGYAYWTSSGGGTGSATSAAAPAALTLTGTVGGLAPGKTVNVPIYAASTNNYRVAINGVTVAATTPAQLKCGGDATGVDLSIGAVTLANPAPVFVPALAAATQVGTVAVSMTDAAYNQDTCKNFQLDLTFTAS